MHARPCGGRGGNVPLAMIAWPFRAFHKGCRAAAVSSGMQIFGNNLPPSVSDGGECIRMFDVAVGIKKLYVFGHMFAQWVFPRI